MEAMLVHHALICENVCWVIMNEECNSTVNSRTELVNQRVVH